MLVLRGSVGFQEKLLMLAKLTGYCTKCEKVLKGSMVADLCTWASAWLNLLGMGVNNDWPCFPVLQTLAYIQQKYETLYLTNGCLILLAVLSEYK